MSLEHAPQSEIVAGNLFRSRNTCFQVNHHIGLLGNFNNDDGDGEEDTL